ncbi:MAG: hypothetical protein K1X56_07930 [Flavobacteriales bacterium]|nr:hypothetical protein [Flavobacteriales bacterium]
MRRLLLFFILNSILLSNTMAQFPRFNFGPEINSTHSDLNICSISELTNGNKLVVRSNYQSNATRYSFEIFDESNTQIGFSTHTFSIPETDRLYYVETITLGEKNWLFISRFNATEKTHVLNAYPITEDGIQENGKMEIDRMPAFNVGNTGKFRLNISPDKKNLVLVHEFPSDKTKNESLSIHIFDQDLKETYHKDHLFDIPSRPNPVNLPFINNNGDVFIIKKDRDKTQYKFLIVSIDKSTRHLGIKPITVTGLLISDIKAGLLHNGNLVVLGFYSSQNYSDYEGMFYFAFDPGGNVAAKHHEMLNSDILSNFMSKKEASKAGAFLSGFSLQHLVAQDNGGLYVLAEKSSITTNNNLDAFLYEDILVLNIDHNGNVKWGKGVKKKQESINDHAKWSSYNFWLHNDTLNLIYNKVFPDDQLTKTGKRKKADEFGDKTFYGSTWSMICPDGSITNNPLLQLHSNHSVPMSLNPELLYQSPKGYVYIMCEDYLRQHHCLAEMQFFSHH